MLTLLLATAAFGRAPVRCAVEGEAVRVETAATTWRLDREDGRVLSEAPGVAVPAPDPHVAVIGALEARLEEDRLVISGAGSCALPVRAAAAVYAAGSHLLVVERGENGSALKVDPARCAVVDVISLPGGPGPGLCSDGSTLYQPMDDGGLIAWDLEAQTLRYSAHRTGTDTVEVGGARLTQDWGGAWLTPTGAERRRWLPGQAQAAGDHIVWLTNGIATVLGPSGETVWEHPAPQVDRLDRAAWSDGRLALTDARTVVLLEAQATPQRWDLRQQQAEDLWLGPRGSLWIRVSPGWVALVDRGDAPPGPIPTAEQLLRMTARWDLSQDLPWRDIDAFRVLLALRSGYRTWLSYAGATEPLADGLDLSDLVLRAAQRATTAEGANPETDALIAWLSAPRPTAHLPIRPLAPPPRRWRPGPAVNVAHAPGLPPQEHTDEIPADRALVPANPNKPTIILPATEAARAWLVHLPYHVDVIWLGPEADFARALDPLPSPMVIWDRHPRDLGRGRCEVWMTDDNILPCWIAAGSYAEPLREALGLHPGEAMLVGAGGERLLRGSPDQVAAQAGFAGLERVDATLPTRTEAPRWSVTLPDPLTRAWLRPDGSIVTLTPWEILGLDAQGQVRWRAPRLSAQVVVDGRGQVYATDAQGDVALYHGATGAWLARIGPPAHVTPLAGGGAWVRRAGQAPQRVDPDGAVLPEVYSVLDQLVLDTTTERSLAGWSCRRTLGADTPLTCAPSPAEPARGVDWGDRYVSPTTEGLQVTRGDQILWTLRQAGWIGATGDDGAILRLGSPFGPLARVDAQGHLTRWLDSADGADVTDHGVLIWNGDRLSRYR